jgi:ABC-2 type transport system permease protein
MQVRPQIPPDKGRLRRLKALIIKEFYQIIHDPTCFLSCILLPLLLMFLYGYGLSLDLNHIRIGLVLEDTSPDAQSFAKSLVNSPYFETYIARDRRYFMDDLIRGRIRAIVIIPSDFSSFRLRIDDKVPIQVIADGSETNTASFAQNYVQGAWSNWLQQESISSNLKGLPLVGTESRFWYNEQLESRNFIIPGSLATIMTLIGTLLTALVVAREWEQGTMEPLLATPVRKSELLLGKIIPYFILGMLSMAMCVAIAILYYHIPFRGSFLVLATVSAIFLLSALAIGLFISTIARTQFVAAEAAMTVSFLPGFILSGFIFEISSMPIPLQMLTYLIPARYFVSSLQTLFLVGNVWKLIIINSIAMLLITAFFFIWTSHRIVKRLD